MHSLVCRALIHRAKQVRAPTQSHKVTCDNRHGHTHKMKWQKWKQIHLHHTISNTDNSGSNKRNEILPLHQEVVNRLEAHFTDNSGSNKRNEILPLHQEVVNRLEAHFTRPLCPCRSPFHTGEPNSQQAKWKPVMKTLQNCVTHPQIPSTRYSKTQYKRW
jgi:hypothetical protein